MIEKEEDMKITKSLELLERAKKVIPGQTSTISKRYGRLPQGVAPAYMQCGNGCTLYDVDRNQFIDWSASLGTTIIGYSRKPISFDYPLPLSTELEVMLAEKLVDIIPCAEMVRFFKNGSDACTAAVILAQKITGRDKYIYSGYHGWTINLLRDNAHRVEYGVSAHDAVILEEIFICSQPACYILEPMDRSCPEKFSYEYLRSVRELCDKYKVILIYDEILTGFRYGLSGIHGDDSDISALSEPDLACYGKAMGNGAAISALVGKRELMKEMEDMRISGTYFTDTNAFSHALYTIGFIEQNDVMNHVWQIGEKLKRGIEEVIIKSNMNGDVRVKGFGPWNSFDWFEDSFDEQQLFLQEIFKRGIFYNRDHFAMYAHTDKEVDKTVEIYKECLEFVFDCSQQRIVKDTLISNVER